MLPREPSKTALSAARHRAAHQVLERARIFADPLALPILGEPAEAVVEAARADVIRLPMRLFIAARTRFAEDALAAAVARGASQLVVLGAGLDTFAYRSPFGATLRVLEVDHPATQAWKRERLAAAGIAVPAWTTYAPCDFERETLGDALAAAGFDGARRTFFTWLGVVPYLTRDAIDATLGYIAAVRGGAEVVFDYADPPETLDATSRAAHDLRAARVRELGEPWQTYFAAAELAAALRAIGFAEIEDVGGVALVSRYVGAPPAHVKERGGHVIRAATATS